MSQLPPQSPSLSIINPFASAFVPCFSKVLMKVSRGYPKPQKFSRGYPKSQKSGRGYPKSQMVKLRQVLVEEVTSVWSALPTYLAKLMASGKNIAGRWVPRHSLANLVIREVEALQGRKQGVASGIWWPHDIQVIFIVPDWHRSPSFWLPEFNRKLWLCALFPGQRKKSAHWISFSKYKPAAEPLYTEAVELEAGT